MTTLALDSVEVDPLDLGHKLREALAKLLCKGDRLHEFTHEEPPCERCIRLIEALVKPVARALLVAGKRPNGDYDLAGRGVLQLIQEAQSD